MNLALFSMLFVIGAVSFASIQPHQTVETLARVSPIAERMQQRLETFHSAALSEEILTQKQQLLQQSVTIHFTVDTLDVAPQDTQIRLSEHPDWIVFDAVTNTFVVDTQSVRFFLDDPAHALFQRPTDAIAYPMSHDAMRVVIQGKAQSGYTFDIHSTSQKIAKALMRKQTTIDIPLSFQSGTMLLVTSNGVQELTRLSMGISDYEKSPSGRAANIEKAIDEQLHGIAIQPNDSFSFNEAMRGNSGWKDALVIKHGGALVAEPGGGICQAATTVFRAALLAGLPITKRANHSLYVHYYEKYGVGLDATVYSGKQDFTFHNDTNAPLIFSARNELRRSLRAVYLRS